MCADLVNWGLPRAAGYVGADVGPGWKVLAPKFRPKPDRERPTHVVALSRNFDFCASGVYVPRRCPVTSAILPDAQAIAFFPSNTPQTGDALSKRPVPP